MEASGRILIVDDERHNIEILTDLLKNDYKIMAAETGEQALRAIRGDHQPDLILLDITMPCIAGIDGYEICKRLTDDSRSLDIPVICVTAPDAFDDDNKARGLGLNAVDYITKPFKPVIVKARVKTHIQLKRKIALLDRLVLLDDVTGIPNQRSFDITLGKEVRRASRNGSFISLILLEIDFFRPYKDVYGDIAGDECLRRVAKVMKSVLKRNADFIARCEGGRFAVILPETGMAGGMVVAEEMCHAVAAMNVPHAASKTTGHVSISLGVTTGSPAQSKLPVELMEAADASLRQARERGGNQAFYLYKLPENISEKIING